MILQTSRPRFGRCVVALLLDMLHSLKAQFSSEFGPGCVWAWPEGQQQDDITCGNLRWEQHLHHRRQFGDCIDEVQAQGYQGKLLHPGMDHPHPRWWKDQHPGQWGDQRGDQDVPSTKQGRRYKKVVLHNKTLPRCASMSGVRWTRRTQQWIPWFSTQVRWKIL